MRQEIQLGTLIAGDGADRDAVHVAVVPAVSDIRLFPGQRVALTGTQVETAAGSCYYVAPTATLGREHGVVDPFLVLPIKPGERFWLCLLPGSIESLRHRWTHPAFDAKETSED